MTDVFAVRCPAPACRKYMLVEATDRGTAVPCLICKTGIQIPAIAAAIPLPPTPPAPALPAKPPVAAPLDHSSTSRGYDFSPKPKN